MTAWRKRMRIGEQLRDTAIVRELIDSVEQLPGLASWSPPLGIESHLPQILSWGFIVMMTRGLGGTDALYRKLARAILAGETRGDPTISELSGAGLCVALGAQAGGQIPAGANKTADWRMRWPDGSEIDLEVAVAQKKDGHLRREGFANEMIGAIFEPDREFDILVNAVDLTSKKDRADINAAVREMACGVTREYAGRWAVHGQPITRQPMEFMQVGQDPQPAWWPGGIPRCFLLHGYVAGPETTRAPVQVRIGFGVPVDSYVNPVKRKAEFPQGDAGLPFIVAVNVAALPGGFTEIPKAVAGFLPQWNRVSAILLFQQGFAQNRVFWRWRLVTNPHADRPLPEAICAGQRDLPEPLETGVRLDAETK